MQKISGRKKTFGILCAVLSAIFVAGYVTTNKYVYGHYDVSDKEYANME